MKTFGDKVKQEIQCHVDDILTDIEKKFQQWQKLKDISQISDG